MENSFVPESVSSFVTNTGRGGGEREREERQTDRDIYTQRERERERDKDTERERQREFRIRKSNSLHALHVKACVHQAWTPFSMRGPHPWTYIYTGPWPHPSDQLQHQPSHPLYWQKTVTLSSSSSSSTVSSTVKVKCRLSK